MTRRRIIILTVLLSIVAAACGSGAEEGKPALREFEVTEELIARGAHTYKLNCVPCHGPGGKGDGPSAASLNPRPRDHTNQEYMARLTDDMIAETVRKGGAIRGYPNMPSSPHIKGDEMAGLVAFVRRLSDGNIRKIHLTPE